MGYEVLLKIRACLLLCVLTLFFPILIILAAFYRTLEFLSKYRKFKNIAGDVAVVTGAGHGLGRYIAIELAKKGAHIAVVDINLDGAEETVRSIKAKYNIQCKAYKVDVTDYKQVEKLNNDIKKDIGLVTILVNNAGIIVASNFAKPSCEDIQRMIDVNLKSHFWTYRVFVENMKERRRGHIIAIDSVAGIFPLVYNSLYSATKFGVRGMMRSLRLDLKSLNLDDIKTTLVYPSFLSTNDAVVDISNQVGLGCFYPLIKGKDAAHTIVQAMLRDELEITLPRGFALLSRIYDFFPASCQDSMWLMLNKTLVEKFRKIYNEDEAKLLKGE